LTSLGEGLWGILFNPWLFSEIVMLALQAVMWSLVLRRMPITLAYPFMSLVIVFNLLAAWLLFGETISLQNLGGAFFIVCGILVMSVKKRTVA